MDRESTRLAIAAISASALTLAIVAGFNSYGKKKRREKLAKDVITALLHSETKDKGKGVRPELSHSLGNSLPPATGHKVLDLPNGRKELYDEELIREQLARNYAFFPNGGMDLVRKGRVVVVGCGGVGSWVAVMLARSGVSYIRLVDFDYVTLSSLNRHATATLSDVGTPKVNSVQRAITSFAPWVQIDPHIELWNKKEEGKNRFLEGVDWVVDAIDNISTKVDLLIHCHQNNIKVFSSMGAGTKCDPTRIQIADISQTIYDPLARSVRRRLRLQGVAYGIPVVYSTEVPGDVKLLPLPEEEFLKGDVKELSALDDFRVRILPVLGPMPAVFGLNIATWIICDLAQKPILNPLAVKNRRKLYDKLFRDLISREAKLQGSDRRLPIDEEEVAIIFEDLHRGRATIPPHPVLSRPALVRWNLNEPLGVTNCIVMSPEEADKHEEAWRAGRTPQDVWGPETAKVVQRRAEEARSWKDFVL